MDGRRGNEKQRWNWHEDFREELPLREVGRTWKRLCFNLTNHLVFPHLFEGQRDHFFIILNLKWTHSLYVTKVIFRYVFRTKQKNKTAVPTTSKYQQCETHIRCFYSRLNITSQASLYWCLSWELLHLNKFSFLLLQHQVEKHQNQQHRDHLHIII